MKKIVLLLMLTSLMMTGCGEKKQANTPDKSPSEDVIFVFHHDNVNHFLSVIFILSLLSCDSQSLKPSF